MSQNNRYEAEIAAKVAEADEAGRPLHPAWITQEICSLHQPGLAPDSEDADFWRYFTHKALRQDTGRFISKNYGGSEEERQRDAPLFPGFDYVQRRYIVERDGDEVAILALDLTDDEIDAKTRELRRRGQSCLAHADELARFKHWRVDRTAYAAE